jgi:hypothetical protein
VNRMADDDLAPLAFRMIRVAMNARKRIHETVSASSNVTPCFATLASAFAGSHSNTTPLICYCNKPTTEALVYMRV